MRQHTFYFRLSLLFTWHFRCSSHGWHLFLGHLGEALERIDAICEENKVRETQGKTNLVAQVWDEVLHLRSVAKGHMQVNLPRLDPETSLSYIDRSIPGPRSREKRNQKNDTKKTCEIWKFFGRSSEKRRLMKTTPGVNSLDLESSELVVRDLFMATLLLARTGHLLNAPQERQRERARAESEM